MAVVSVIIPVYRCEKYIASCIESILHQSIDDWNLILVDDGSDDRCPEICDTYASKDSRITVIHKENGGVSSARNAGIAAATGTYITFVDSDDYLDPQFLQDLLHAAKENEADLVVSGLTMDSYNEGKLKDSQVFAFTQDKSYEPKILLEAWEKEFPPICMCGPWCKLYRRDILMRENIRFLQDLNCGEDTYFNLEYLEHARKIQALSQCYYHYRRENEDSLFSRFHADTYEVHHRVYGKMRLVMEKLCCSHSAMQDFENNYFSLLLGGIHEYFRFYDRTSYQQKKLLVQKIAKDPYVAKLKTSQIIGTKNRLLHRLLKMGLYDAVLAVFRVHYRK